jgi:hypothetical protein
MITGVAEIKENSFNLAKSIEPISGHSILAI